MLLALLLIENSAPAGSWIVSAPLPAAHSVVTKTSGLAEAMAMLASKFAE
jgi:hypothetical protein